MQKVKWKSGKEKKLVAESPWKRALLLASLMLKKIYLISVIFFGFFKLNRNGNLLSLG
jgi:hypothetical protein